MRYTGRLFAVRSDAPTAPPVPAPDRFVDAPDVDTATAALAALLAADGFRVRAISHAPGCLVAYVEGSP